MSSFFFLIHSRDKDTCSTAHEFVKFSCIRKKIPVTCFKIRYFAVCFVSLALGHVLWNIGTVTAPRMKKSLMENFFFVHCVKLINNA